MLWVRCYLNDEYSQTKKFQNNYEIQFIKNDKIKKIQTKVFQIIKEIFKIKILFQ